MGRIGLAFESQAKVSVLPRVLFVLCLWVMLLTQDGHNLPDVAETADCENDWQIVQSVPIALTALDEFNPVQPAPVPVQTPDVEEKEICDVSESGSSDSSSDNEQEVVPAWMHLTGETCLAVMPT